MSAELSLAVVTCSDTLPTISSRLFALVVISFIILCRVSRNTLIPVAILPISSLLSTDILSVRSPCPDCTSSMTLDSLLSILPRGRLMLRWLIVTPSTSTKTPMIKMITTINIEELYLIFCFEMADSIPFLLLLTISLISSEMVLPNVLRVPLARFSASSLRFFSLRRIACSKFVRYSS